MGYNPNRTIGPAKRERPSELLSQSRHLLEDIDTQTSGAVSQSIFRHGGLLSGWEEGAADFDKNAALLPHSGPDDIATSMKADRYDPDRNFVGKKLADANDQHDRTTKYPNLRVSNPATPELRQHLSQQFDAISSKAEQVGAQSQWGPRDSSLIVDDAARKESYATYRDRGSYDPTGFSPVFEDYPHNHEALDYQASVVGNRDVARQYGESATDDSNRHYLNEGDRD